MDEEKMAANAVTGIEADTTNAETVTDVDNADDNEKVVFTDGTPAKDDKRAATKAFSNRLKEERAKIEKEYAEKKQKELDAIAVSRGFKDWNELSDYSNQEKLEQIGIKDTKVFNEYVSDLISNNPSVIEAQKIIESAKEKEQEEIIKTAISEINAVDSDIKSVDDLLNMPNYDAYYDLVSKGYSLTDAYKIVAFDKITSHKAASAAQVVKNNIESKGHMKSMTGGQPNDVIVPDDVLAMYHKNLPQMSEQEIKDHYKKYLGGN
jgi:hypothetical protein